MRASSTLCCSGTGRTSSQPSSKVCPALAPFLFHCPLCARSCTVHGAARSPARAFTSHTRCAPHTRSRRLQGGDPRRLRRRRPAAAARAPPRPLPDPRRLLPDPLRRRVRVRHWPRRLRLAEAPGGPRGGCEADVPGQRPRVLHRRLPQDGLGEHLHGGGGYPPAPPGHPADTPTRTPVNAATSPPPPRPTPPSRRWSGRARRCAASATPPT